MHIMLQLAGFDGKNFEACEEQVAMYIICNVNLIQIRIGYNGYIILYV